MSKTLYKLETDFPADIEEIVWAYLITQAHRSGLGEISISTHIDGLNRDRLAVRYHAIRPDENRTFVLAKSIEEAADDLCEFKRNNSPEACKARRIAEIEAELATLKTQ